MRPVGNNTVVSGTSRDARGFLFALTDPLTGSVFELQLVHRGIPPEALKRGEPEMAKVKWRVAGPDDPIFNGKFVISAPSKSKSNPINPQESSPTDTTGQSVHTKKEEKIDE